MLYNIIQGAKLIHKKSMKVGNIQTKNIKHKK